MDRKRGLKAFYEACRDIRPGIDGVVHNSLQPKIKIFEGDPGHPQERDLALPPDGPGERPGFPEREKAPIVQALFSSCDSVRFKKGNP
jgi:hypothetical protein